MLFGGNLSLPLGSCCFGIPVRLHVTFFLVLIIQVLAALPAGKQWALLWFITYGPVLLFTITVHEIGHSLAARCVGGKAEGILLWPLGGLAFIHHTASPRADMWVAFAGPLTHIPMLIIWLLGQLAATQAAYGRAFVTVALPNPEGKALAVAVISMAILLNVTLFLFNLLVPAYPLDSGRILVDALLMCGVSTTTTAKITLAIAVVMAVGILVLGAVTVQAVTILVAVFILFACWQLFDCLRKGQIDQHPLFAFTASQRSQQQQQQAAAAAAASAEAGRYSPFVIEDPPARPGAPGGTVIGRPVV